MKNILNDNFRELLFFNIKYTSNVIVTLISTNILKNKNYYWNIKNDFLFNKKNDQKICEIKTHFDFNTLKYNSLKFTLINSIQLRDFERIISWI